MSFVHLGLLWLLPLALLPVLLHLLTLQRLRTVELSTFRFLFDSYVQQRRRMQFLEALLAILRTLFLLGLVIALSRPIVRHWDKLFQGSGSGREVVLLVDCSASMNAVNAGESSFKRAKDAAKAVTDKLQPGDRLTLVRVASKPEEVLSRVGVEGNGIQEKIDALKTSPARANFFAALMHVFGPENKRRVNPVVYVFTDCQSSGWKEIRSQGLDRTLPDGTPIVVVQVGAAQPTGNVAVLGNPPRRRAVVGLPVVFRPRVKNFSKNPVEATLSVQIDDREIARTTLNLKPDETATPHVVYEPTEPGSLRGRFEITVKGGDAFPDDDRYLFTLYVVPRIRVVIVNGNPSADRFENESLYLRTALSTPAPAADPKKPGVPLDRDLLRSLEVRDLPENALSPEVLRDAGVVILANCGALNGTHFAWLREYVADGGGLLVLPGDRVNPDTYNAQFFNVQGPQKEQLSAVRFGKAEGDPDKAETFERLVEIDYAHPALSVFDNPEAQYFRQVTVKRHFPLLLPPKRDNGFPLAKFANGTPALVESRLGEGTAIVSAFPANVKWTNLPLRNEFVPLLLRLVGHLQRRPEVEPPAAVLPDGVAEFSVAGTWHPATGKVTTPSGITTALEFERSGPRLVAHYDLTGEGGYYTAELQGSRPDQKGGSLLFAVNLAAEESDPAALGEAQFKELLPAAELTFVDASADTQQGLGRLGSETEFWQPLIYILFAVILVEFLLSTLGGGKRRAGAEGSGAERVHSYNPTSWVARMTGARKAPS